MKKTKKGLNLFIYVIILIGLLFIFGCTDHSDDNNLPENNTWTIMVYLVGDNNLEQSALDDINEMELANLEGEDVNVIVLVDRCSGYTTADGDWKGTRLYKIEKDADVNIINSTRLADPVYLNLTDTGDIEELEMDNPLTVTDFIDFCQINYLADRYALIFWNHGGGWRNKSSLEDKSFTEGFIFEPRYLGSSKEKNPKESINKAVCWDDTSGVNECLYMSEVESAITGKGIDLVGFDACLMGMAEVAWQLFEETDYMVASEEVEPICGWAYKYFLDKFIVQQDKSPANLGKAIVDSYIDNTPYSGLTLSVIKTSNMGNLLTKIDTFASNLITANVDDVCAGRCDTLCFYTPHYIDLYDFASNLSSIAGGSALMTEIGNTVTYHRHKGMSDSHGLSIYYPLTDLMDSEYVDYNGTVIDFPGASQWDEFLTDYYADVTYYTIETFPNAGSESNATDTYLVLFTENGNYIYEDDDSGSYNHSKLVLPLVSGQVYYILNKHIQRLYYYYKTGPYSILANIGGGGSSTGNPATDVHESNNTSGEATILPYNTVQDHYMTSSDYDWMKVTIP